MRQAKYARRYLAEAAYRFNRRFQLAELLPRLARGDALQALARAEIARRRQLPWLSVVTNQVTARPWTVASITVEVAATRR